jgi:transposase-like protein
VKPSQISLHQDEKRAGQWQSSMRQGYKGNKLTDERIAILNAVEGWTWDDDTFFSQLEKWKIQYRKKGGKPSGTSKDPDEKRACQWQSYMRQGYKGNKLTDKRIAILNAVEGWTWDDDTFFSQLEKWKIQYRKKGGKPSETSKDPVQKRACQWQNNMHRAYNGKGRGTLTDERIAILNAVEGWTWSQ